MKFDFLQAVTDAHSAQAAKMSALLQEGFRLEGERDSQKKDRDKKEHESGQDVLTVMLLSELDDIESVELQAQIARHDQAIIEALIENEERLAAADRRVEKLLGEAHILPDGRRVFKTEDGLRVFDEFGREVGADDVDPASIDDFRPSWETASSELDARDALVEERRDLLDYQHKLDEAQDKLANGDMSQSDLDQLHSLMADDVPEAVRRHLPPDDPAALTSAPQFSGAQPTLITDTNSFDFN
jgi:hypothetical protein